MSTTPTAQTPFFWRTNRGELLPPCEMDTTHLMNSLLMVWNNTVPEALQFQPFRRWHLCSDTEYYTAAVKALLTELRARPLDSEQQAKLAAMEERVRVFYGATRDQTLRDLRRVQQLDPII